MGQAQQQKPRRKTKQRIPAGPPMAAGATEALQKFIESRWSSSGSWTGPLFYGRIPQLDGRLPQRLIAFQIHQPARPRATQGSRPRNSSNATSTTAAETALRRVSALASSVM